MITEFRWTLIVLLIKDGNLESESKAWLLEGMQWNHCAYHSVGIERWELDTRAEGVFLKKPVLNARGWWTGYCMSSLRGDDIGYFFIDRHGTMKFLAGVVPVPTFTGDGHRGLSFTFEGATYRLLDRHDRLIERDDW